MKILFITTHNLATNPRLYKEVLLAKGAGNTVEILCFEFNNWSKTNNDFLIQQLGDIKIHKLPADRSKFGLWLLSVTLERIFRFFAQYINLNPIALSQAVSRRSILLTKALSNISKPDIVIGHNPGAIWPTLKAAKKFNCKAGFDVEDYHPGENLNKILQSITKRLMVELLPKFDYVSFASPLILQHVIADIGLKQSNWFTVLNYFPKTDFKEPICLDDGLIKMVWFSQNINAGRGLELILSFIKKNINKVELHLIGNLNSEFYEKKLINIPNIYIHSPIQQIELHQKLSSFDFGLALETAKDLNNDLAISNKILAYLQAGLYIVASDTSAQLELINNWQNHGICFEYEHNNFEIILNELMEKIQLIRKEKQNRFNNFKNTNWETVSVDILNQWNK